MLSCASTWLPARNDWPKTPASNDPVFREQSRLLASCAARPACHRPTEPIPVIIGWTMPSGSRTQQQRAPVNVPSAHEKLTTEILHSISTKKSTSRLDEASSKTGSSRREDHWLDAIANDLSIPSRSRDQTEARHWKSTAEDGKVPRSSAPANCSQTMQETCISLLFGQHQAGRFCLATENN